MRTRARSFLATLLLATTALCGTAFAQAKTPIPNHALAEHKATLDHLTGLAAEPGAVGLAARHVLAAMVPHDQREEAFVLPLLGLIDDIAADKVVPEMAWAVPMAARLQSERAALYDEHTTIISGLIELTAAAQTRNDASLVAFAEQVAADEINDGEFVYPAALLVGRLVREKLAKP